MFGEDVGRKGGVYGVTRGLARRFGSGRVFDTLLDEQAILGLGLGVGVTGLLPVPEIQYLAYLHNAEDQLRGEAASLRFFSDGQYRNPMVVRVAGLAYQKGFGGHFHNDNARRRAARHPRPGGRGACPAAQDAAPMLRTCLAAAEADGTVCVFLEPIALYHARDLYEPGDGAWLAPYAGPQRWEQEHVPVGQGRSYGDGTDLTLVTFGNGVPMCLRVARRLAAAGVRAPRPRPALARSRCRSTQLLAATPTATGRVLVADETRQSRRRRRGRDHRAGRRRVPRARWPGSPRPTATSRWVTPPPTSCCRRRTSSGPPGGCWNNRERGRPSDER